MIHSLVLSLEGSVDETPDEVAKAWDQEIARRVADMEAGRTRWISDKEVFAEIDTLIAEHDK